jgi:hypothetical protein
MFVLVAFNIPTLQIQISVMSPFIYESDLECKADVSIDVYTVEPR